jgi:hypothetical protein
MVIREDEISLSPTIYSAISDLVRLPQRSTIHYPPTPLLTRLWHGKEMSEDPRHTRGKCFMSVATYW